MMQTIAQFVKRRTYDFRESTPVHLSAPQFSIFHRRQTPRKSPEFADCQQHSDYFLAHPKVLAISSNNSQIHAAPCDCHHSRPKPRRPQAKSPLRYQIVFCVDLPSPESLCCTAEKLRRSLTSSLRQTHPAVSRPTRIGRSRRDHSFIPNSLARLGLQTASLHACFWWLLESDYRSSLCASRPAADLSIFRNRNDRQRSRWRERFSGRRFKRL